MTLFVLKRTGGALLVLLTLSVIVYALFYLAPGDPARLACGERCNPAQIAQVREQLGLNDSAPTQYLHFLQGLLVEPATTPAEPGSSCTATRPAWDSRTRTTSRSPS